jgi:hypothetical protein
LLDREELLRQPPLQPKPQFRKFGADSKRWKRPEPAAILDSALALRLPYFYIDEVFAGPSFERPRTRTFMVYSGDGQQSVTTTIPDPFPSQFPDLQLPPESQEWFGYSNAGFNFPSGTELFPTPGNVQINFGANNANGEVVRYSKSRLESLSSDAINLRLPLGNGKCLVIYAFRNGLKSWIFERGFWDTTSGIARYYTNSKEYDESFISHVAFICSLTEARQVTIPDILIEEIYSRLRLARISNLLISIDRGTYMQLNRLPNLINLTQEFLDDNPGLGLALEFNDAVVPLYLRGGGGNFFYDFDRFGLFQYGLLNQGGATPSSWFEIGNPIFTEPFLTHEAIQAVGINGLSIQQALKRGFYLAVPFTDDNMPARKVLYWKPGLPTGEFVSDVIPRLDEPLGNWRIKNNSTPSIAPPPLDAAAFRTLYYINDWGSPQFCRQQAERWGVANL